MILKYTLRLIKSTLNRFIAILAIVFIGVSFMMGLRSNYNIMKNSVEDYVDAQDLYDIQMYSNFGFDSNDVKAIKNLECVENIFASKTRDAFVKDKKGNELVSRLLEIESNLNLIELKEGRMPEKENECVIISGYTSADLKIGDTVSAYFKDGEISETLKNNKFTIVGTAKSSEYMSETFTTSLLDNKELNAIIYVPNSNFISDYYTCLYIQLDGAKDLDSFSKEYDALLDKDADTIEAFSVNQSQELRNKIVEEATTKLNDAKAELAENKEKYQKELDEGKKKLNDSKALLDSSKKEIEDGEAQIPEAERQIAEGQAQINAGYEELKAAEEEYKAGVAQIENYGMSVDQLASTVTGLHNTYNSAKQNIATLEAQKNNILNQKTTYEEVVKGSGYSSASEVRNAIAQTDPSSPDYQKLVQVYNAYVFLESCDMQVQSIDSKINILTNTLNTAESTMQSTFGMGIEDGYTTIMSLVNQIKQGEAQIKQGYLELKQAQIELDNAKVALEEGKIKLAEGKKKYEQGLKEYNEGLAKYNEGVEEFNKQIQDAEDQIEDGEKQLKDLQEVEWHILKRYNTNYSFYMYKNTCEQMKSIGYIIPLLFFVVAALVCSTTMTRLIDEQRGQIGIYRALGFRKQEIIGIYLLYVIIASLAASLVAVFVGIVSFPTIIYNTWRLMYDLPKIKLSMPIDILFICISCFTLLMVVVTYIVINNSLKETSAQLLRPKAPKSTKQIILEKWKWLWSKLPFTSKVTARNILRYKGRFIMTIIGVAGCTSLLLLGFGIKDSIGSVVTLQFGEINRYDYSVLLKNDRHIDQILEEIKADSNNEAYLAYETYTSAMTVGDTEDTINVNVIDKNNYSSIFGITDYKTQKPVSLSDNGVLISKKFCDVNNLSIGDQIEIESYSGIKKNVTIEGIITNYVGDVIYMSEGYYKNAFNEDIEYTTIGVVNKGDSSKLISLQDKFNDVNTVNDLSSSAKTFNDMIQALDLIILVIIVVAGALAFVVLINLTNVNISERIREIATLKVLGFREGEVDSYIFKEVFLMSVVGAIIGLPLGNIEERYVMTTIDMEMCTFPNIIFPISYVYAFVITIIFTGIVLILTRKTLRNVEMVESLKSVE